MIFHGSLSKKGLCNFVQGLPTHTHTCMEHRHSLVWYTHINMHGIQTLILHIHTHIYTNTHAFMVDTHTYSQTHYKYTHTYVHRIHILKLYIQTH